jgi:hypothetical protein
MAHSSWIASHACASAAEGRPQRFTAQGPKGAASARTGRRGSMVQTAAARLQQTGWPATAHRWWTAPTVSLTGQWTVRKCFWQCVGLLGTARVSEGGLIIDPVPASCAAVTRLARLPVSVLTHPAIQSSPQHCSAVRARPRDRCTPVDQTMLAAIELLGSISGSFAALD